MPLFKPIDLPNVRTWLRSEDLPTTTGWQSQAPGFRSENTVDGSGDVSQISIGDKSKGGKGGADGSSGSTDDNISIGGTQGGADDDATGPMDVLTGDYYCGVFCKYVNNSDVQALLSNDSSGAKFELRVSAARKVVAALFQNDTTAGQSQLLSYDNYYWVNSYRESSVAYSGVDDHHQDGTVNAPDKISKSEPLFIGSRSGSAKVWAGTIYEVLILHYAPSDSNRKRIEGYVSHKFENESNLTQGTHDYDQGPPTTCHSVSEKTLSTNFLSSNPSIPYGLSENLNIFCETRK